MLRARTSGLFVGFSRMAALAVTLSCMLGALPAPSASAQPCPDPDGFPCIPGGPMGPCQALTGQCQAGACIRDNLMDGTECAPRVSDCYSRSICLSGLCLDGVILGAGVSCTPESPGECEANTGTCDDFGVCVADLAPGGTACGGAPSGACDAQNTCDGTTGVCVANSATAGTPCGSAGDGQCDSQDTCDGSGGCVDRVAALGTLCGDGSVTDCTAADTCDNSGTCLTNHTADGTSCEGPDFCTSGDMCAAGVCVEGSADPCTAPQKCNEVVDMCLAPCGDGIVDMGEACDDGTRNSDTAPNSCRTDCTLPRCGDGVVDSGEACDDGAAGSATCDTSCASIFVPDQGVAPDAGSAADAGSEPATSGGSGCAIGAHPSAGAPWAAVLGLAGLMVRRRRR